MTQVCEKALTNTLEQTAIREYDNYIAGTGPGSFESVLNSMLRAAESLVQPGQSAEADSRLASFVPWRVLGSCAAISGFGRRTEIHIAPTLIEYDIDPRPHSPLYHELLSTIRQQRGLVTFNHPRHASPRERQPFLKGRRMLLVPEVDQHVSAVQQEIFTKLGSNEDVAIRALLHANVSFQP